jgi:UDP-N-acetylmuramyl pentapeptide synthase
MKAAPEVAARRFVDVKAAVEILRTERPKDLLVLVKGSRGVKLVEVVVML